MASDLSLVELLSHILQEVLVYDRIPAAAKLALIARELLMNAVVHGNRNDPRKQVSLSLERLDEGQFRLRVKDEGRGFDYSRLDTRLPQRLNERRRRGYAIVAKLADRIEFNGNGSEVVVMAGPDNGNIPA